MIEKAQLRITIQKKRNDSIIRQSRADIAQLLQIGQLDQAFARVHIFFLFIYSDVKFLFFVYSLFSNYIVAI